tara:strand:- start:604 stop:798 length:195 start_codon:yes stop_codon:yes gene_type:complete
MPSDDDGDKKAGALSRKEREREEKEKSKTLYASATRETRQHTVKTTTLMRERCVNARVCTTSTQ